MRYENDEPSLTTISIQISISVGLYERYATDTVLATTATIHLHVRRHHDSRPALFAWARGRILHAGYGAGGTLGRVRDDGDEDTRQRHHRCWSSRTCGIGMSYACTRRQMRTIHKGRD